MKFKVYYYSRKGSNKYLAQRIASDLNCEMEEIRPRLNTFLFMMMNLNLGNRKLKSNPTNYDKVILCHPIFMGKLIVPLKKFIIQNTNQINALDFVTSCGSTFAKKDEKFGHNLVFQEVKRLLGSKCEKCQAFPIGLVLPKELQESPDAFMHNHLNNENFKGEILSLYQNFISEYLGSAEKLK